MTSQNPDDQELDEQLGRASNSALDAMDTLVDVEACLREQGRRMAIRRSSQEPLEITHARRRARLYTILGGGTATTLTILSLADASWVALFPMGVLTLLFMWLRSQNTAYAHGYRRGLAAGKTWCDDVPLPTSGKQSDAAIPPRDQR